jgi:hypothetical protein
MHKLKSELLASHLISKVLGFQKIIDLLNEMLNKTEPPPKLIYRRII